MHQVVFTVVAEDDADARYSCYLVGGILGEASNHGDNGIGVGGHGLAYGVAAFLLGDGGDGAGVDNVEVGLVGEVGLLPSFGEKTADEV